MKYCLLKQDHSTLQGTANNPLFEINPDMVFCDALYGAGYFAWDREDNAWKKPEFATALDVGHLLTR